MNTNGYRMSWAPAAMPPAAPILGALLGQQDIPWTLKRTPAIITDLIVMGTSFFYAQGLRAIGNRWSTLWYVVAGAATIKALHDFSREA